jgi:hypothetical protein
VNFCFVTGTPIETSNGFVAVENLRSGDRVMTIDAGYQPIRWIFARYVSPKDLRDTDTLCPILIENSELGSNSGPIAVSRQHRIMVNGKIAQRMCGNYQVLVPAKDLLGLDGVSIDTSGHGFWYHHILLDGHHILNAGGIGAESLLMEDKAQASLSADARAELDILFPNGLKTLGAEQARPILEGKRARNLVARHIKNHKKPRFGFDC